MKTFGKMVHEARTSRELTRKELAAICGIQDTTVRSIELGRTRSASLYNTLRICAALAITVEEAAAACLHENISEREIKALPKDVAKRLRGMARQEIQQAIHIHRAPA